MTDGDGAVLVLGSGVVVVADDPLLEPTLDFTHSDTFFRFLAVSSAWFVAYMN